MNQDTIVCVLSVSTAIPCAVVLVILLWTFVRSDD